MGSFENRCFIIRGRERVAIVTSLQRRGLMEGRFVRARAAIISDALIKQI